MTVSASFGFANARSKRNNIDSRTSRIEILDDTYEKYLSLEERLNTRLRLIDHELSSFGNSPAIVIHALRKVGPEKMWVTDWTAVDGSVLIGAYALNEMAVHELADTISNDYHTFSRVVVETLPAEQPFYVGRYLIRCIGK